MKLKVYLQPTGLHSRAMTRVCEALKRYSPTELVEIVSNPDIADLHILHVINKDAISYSQSLNKPYAVIQYCLKTAGLDDISQWRPFWQSSRLVWSYYDLTKDNIPYFYYAPLGVDECFYEPYISPTLSRSLVLTTGFVSGPGAEAIEEVWDACRMSKLSCYHVGPDQVQGMSKPNNWRSVNNISDEQLRSLYRRALYVASLRHIEGFELPALEGLVNGARPILFEQPTTRHWYADHAYYVADYHGEALVDELCNLFCFKPFIGSDERDEIYNKFRWSSIATGFWDSILFAI